ncbi:MAG: hypothetical protein AB7O37_04390 [Vicinamibacteria bacterium]
MAAQPVPAAPPEEPPPAGALVSGESLAAREQGRVCISVEVPAADSLAACREALRLGLRGERAAAIRLALAQKLADALDWEGAVAVYGELVHDRPGDAAAWLRLGQAQLLGVGLPAQALVSLETAARLAPGDADAACLLGQAYNAVGRQPEAIRELERAQLLDAGVLERRPGAREALEAARRGEAWPGAYQPTQNGPSPKSQST